MFIKKDLRKVEEILADKEDKRDVLKLSKRTAEFQGNLRIICRESKLESLRNLKALNLYDNSLTNLNGIGILSQTPIEEINLGCNKLSMLPLEFGTISTLKTVWLDDNEFEMFPTSLCQIKSLVSIRISGNVIKQIPALISGMSNLETLAIDNNDIDEFPTGLIKLANLKNLWLRQNKLTELPNNLDEMKSLEILSISSNQIRSLPDCLSNMTRLQRIYANGNKISYVPDTLPLLLTNIKEINLANNLITTIPTIWIEKWGNLDKDSGTLKTDSQSKIKILLIGNLVVQ